MKEFRTEIRVTPAADPMGLRTPVVTMGSCFADAIGSRLTKHKIRALVNPFGVIYNPESIHKVLSGSIFNEPLPEHTFVANQQLFFNYNFHSEFSDVTLGALQSRLANAVEATHQFLKDARWLLITYGTAWIYSRNDTGEVVANCHKLPAKMFTRAMLDVKDITDSFAVLYDQLRELNPDIRIILTVSPVRHLKDTLELNSASKSVLRVACHQIAHAFDNVEYFPAFEMMVDDLRDYRFYKRDMLHPTTEAEDYIWEKFMERYFSRELMDFVAKWKEILSAMQHRPFHLHSPAHQQFLRDTLKKLEAVKEVDVQEEIALIKQQMLK